MTHALWSRQKNSIHRAVHLLLWSSFPNSLPIFFTAINSKDHPTVNGKNSAKFKCRANLSAKHWMHWIPTSNVSAFAVSFADPQQEGSKFHSLLGSVGELTGDKLYFSSPSLQSHLWNLLKSSRHVTSRNQGTFSRWREDPGNEVVP